MAFPSKPGKKASKQAPPPKGKSSGKKPNGKAAAPASKTKSAMKKMPVGPQRMAAPPMPMAPIGGPIGGPPGIDRPTPNPIQGY